MCDNVGPWNEFEVVDGTEKDDIVGIKRKGENKICFTMEDMKYLPNYLVEGKNLIGLPERVKWIESRSSKDLII